MASPSTTDRSTPVAPIPPSPAEVAQILEDAADIMLVNGRCSINAKDGAGRYCLVGAVMAARGLDVQRGSVSQTQKPLIEQGILHRGYADPALGYVAAYLGIGSASVSMWNDATEDDGEVRDTLLTVAKNLRAEAVPS